MMSITTPAGRMRIFAVLACAVLGTACSTSPTTGRTQFNILPEQLETTVPDLRFEVHTLLTSKAEYCREDENPCPALELAERLSKRMAPIADLLGNKAVELSPELARRVPVVEVFVVAKDSPSVISSAGGKIAVSSALAQLDLPDEDLALALAREFGRLAAAHHRESTSAGLAVSIAAGSPLAGAYLATSILADILFPMGTLFKLGISLIGSMGTEQLVELSQQEEADDFAGKLMLAAGYDLGKLARPHAGLEEGAIKIGWLPRFVESRARIAKMTADNATMAIAANGELERAPEPSPATVASAPGPVAAPPPERVAPDLNPADAPLPETAAGQSAKTEVVPAMKVDTAQREDRPAEVSKAEEEAPQEEAKPEEPKKKPAAKKGKKKPRKSSKAAPR
jgi:Zn-dependent protease with chaperone function